MVVDLATASEHPRAFEVVAQIMSALSSVNKDLMGLHAQREMINKSQDVVSGDKSTVCDNSSTVNNIIFSGSTKELQDILSKRKLKILDEDPTI